jgi:hypothetical protein
MSAKHISSYKDARFVTGHALPQNDTLITGKSRWKGKTLLCLLKPLKPISTDEMIKFHRSTGTVWIGNRVRGGAILSIDPVKNRSEDLYTMDLITKLM